MRRVLRSALLAAIPVAASVACVTRVTPSRTLRASYATPLVAVAGASEGAMERAADSALLGDSLHYRYADSVVEIRTAMLADRVALRITNLTDEPLTIVWEDARYTDFDGETTTVSRAEGKRAKGAVPVAQRAVEPPTVIGPHRTFVGAVLPDSRVVHYPGHDGPFGWRSGGWGNAPLMTVWSTTVTGVPGSPDAERQREAFVSDVRDMMGKRIGIMIPLRSGEVSRDYTLWFAVRGASIIDE